MTVPGPAPTRGRGAVVLVEGESDRVALLTLARARGLEGDLPVVAMGGITNLGRHLAATPDDVRPVVLHDAGESAYVARTVARSGREVSLHVCDADLEDELIRALGVPAALEVVEAAGDLGAWRTLRRQPFHRGRDEAPVLRRFLGTTSGRKARYAALLVAALDPAAAPRPLTEALDGLLR